MEKEELIIVKVKDKMCDNHKPVKLSFSAWQDYARANYDDDIVQTKCPKCGYWLFPEEM